MFARIGVMRANALRGDAGAALGARSRSDIAASQARGLSQRQSIMAQLSEYAIVTYERKPGHWRAAVTLKAGSGMVRGDQVRSVVTPVDYASEAEAQFAAEKLVRKL